jgi:hypothetical protein
MATATIAPTTRMAVFIVLGLCSSLLAYLLDHLFLSAYPYVLRQR